jgi:fructose-bisphosphate aldolase, class I
LFRINNSGHQSGLINSGGAAEDAADLKEAVITAIINKRAGGTGLISGRKVFQRSLNDGIALLNTIQDLHLAENIAVA